jgi:hypothetical protein
MTHPRTYIEQGVVFGLWCSVESGLAASDCKNLAGYEMLHWAFDLDTLLMIGSTGGLLWNKLLTLN